MEAVWRPFGGRLEAKHDKRESKKCTKLREKLDNMELVIFLTLRNPVSLRNLKKPRFKKLGFLNAWAKIKRINGS